MLKKIYLLFLLFVGIGGNAAEQKIVIIGGGLAGLTAAYRLVQAGKNVEVYEARNRPGGRVFTCYFSGSYEEIGAKFIDDGGEAENLKTLIHEVGLEIQDYQTAITDRKYYYNGQIDLYYSPFQNAPPPNVVLQEKLEAWQKNTSNMKEILDALFAGKNLARHLVEIHMRGYYGSDSNLLSTHYLEDFWHYYQKIHAISEGEKQNNATHMTIKGGNNLLPLRLAISLGSRMHYSHPVKAIGKKRKGKFEIYFKEGSSIQADILVLAIPCSTLRDIQVQNGLIPPNQWKAIQKLPYGNNTYILMGVAMNEEKAREYSVTENAIAWFNHDQKIVTLDLGGSKGDFPIAATSRIIEKELFALKKLFPSLIYTGNYRVVNWLREEYSKGSYSNIGTSKFDFLSEKSEYAGETIRKAFFPIENRIFFAGEHVDLNHPGTMEGAVTSGEMVARLIQRL